MESTPRKAKALRTLLAVMMLAGIVLWWFGFARSKASSVWMILVGTFFLLVALVWGYRERYQGPENRKRRVTSTILACTTLVGMDFWSIGWSRGPLWMLVAGSPFVLGLIGWLFRGCYWSMGSRKWRMAFAVFSLFCLEALSAFCVVVVEGHEAPREGWIFAYAAIACGALWAFCLGVALLFRKRRAVTLEPNA